VIKAKEKSPEKKPSKGLLYALGQKFEKLRDSAMSKEKKAGSAGAAAASLACTQKQGSPEERSSPEKYKKKVVETEKSLDIAAPEDKRVDKRSRFDTMLRSLRERSVPRSQPNGRVSPKRAASVEELHAGSQEGQGKSGGAVNKMFGGFLRRFDRESSEQRRVRSTRSTSNIERQVREEQDRLLDASLPTSPIYQNVVKAQGSKVKATPTPAAVEENCNCETACPDCRQNKVQNLTTSSAPSNAAQAASSKEKRKGLMLDLASANASGSGAPSSVTTATTTTTSGSSYRGSKTNPALLNGNGALGMGIYSNLPPYPGAIKSASSNNSSSQQSMENATNNNSTNTNNNCSSQTSGYRPHRQLKAAAAVSAGMTMANPPCAAAALTPAISARSTSTTPPISANLAMSVHPRLPKMRRRSVIVVDLDVLQVDAFHHHRNCHKWLPRRAAVL